MKIKTTILFFLLLISNISFSQSGTKNFIDQPYIEVIGKSEKEIIPNQIFLNIVINENDKKGRISIEKQENKMISVLKSLGINLEKDFSVLDFNGYFKRKFLANDEVSKTKRYQLIVGSGEMLGKVYQALDIIDVSNISIIKVGHTDIEEINQDAKLNALRTAKEKAENYTNVINQSLGKALFIQELNVSNGRNYMSNSLDEVVITGYGANRTKQEQIQDLNFKPIKLTASVLVRFIIN